MVGAPIPMDILDMINLRLLTQSLDRMRHLYRLLEVTDDAVQNALIDVRRARAMVQGIRFPRVRENEVSLGEEHREVLRRSEKDLLRLNGLIEVTKDHLTPTYSSLRRTLRLLGGEYGNRTDQLTFPLTPPQLPYRFEAAADVEIEIARTLERAQLDKLRDARGRDVQVRVVPTYTLL
jgi:hypothetical protein